MKTVSIIALTVMVIIASNDAEARKRGSVIDEKFSFTDVEIKLIPVNGVVVYTNGRRVNFGDARLYKIGGRLQVPLRPVAEALGATVTYSANQDYPALKIVTVVHGRYRYMQNSFSVQPGETLLPLRALSEALGATVRATPQRIDIDTPTEGQAVTPAKQLEPVPQATPAATSDGDIAASDREYNLNQLNYYRQRAGAPLLKLDDKLNAFARDGSLELMRNHVPHKHFKDADIWSSGFTGGAAENQGDPNGWFPGPTQKVIADIVKSMMDEGPGGGHHDNILNPRFKRVGIGLVKDARGRLYLTNDFSE